MQCQTLLEQIAAIDPLLLNPLEDIARGILTAANYYESRGINDPPTEKESDDVRYGGNENQTDA